MDKQSFKKHHFWILLVLAIILIPIALSGAVFGVGGMAEEKSKKIKEKAKALDSQSPKGDGYRKALVEQKEELQRQKDRVWAAAFQAQEGLLRWPNALSRLNDQMTSPNVSTPAQLYFGDPISPGDLATFRRDDVYQAEYNRLPEIIAPTEFADKSWQEVLTRHVKEWKSDPTPEEMWLALEDLCVEREVLHDIQAVNQMIAEFLPDPQPVKEPAKPKGKAPEELKRYQDDMTRYNQENAKYLEKKKVVDEELKAAHNVKAGEFAGRYISPYWRLDLVVGRPSQGKAGELAFRGKLTNTGTRRQNVARIEFKVWLVNPNRGSSVQYVLLPLQKDFLEADKSFDFAETRIGASEPTLKIYKVEQKLDARSVPVKQVAKLELLYPANRFADKALVMASFSDAEVKKMPPPPPPAPGVAPGAAAAAPATDVTPNGIPRMRYLQQTDQVRRMPIGIVLIVDQGHVQDVIRALSNSRLRFQNTQIHYERFRGVISLDEGGATPAPAATGPGGAPPLPRLNDIANRDRRGGGEFGGRNRGNRPMGGPPGEHNINPAADEENSANLVELTVYGLISLYEHFPPKLAAGQAPPAGVAPPPGAPPAVAPAVPPPPPPPNAPVPPAAGPPGGLPPPAPLGGNPTGTAPPKPG